MAEGDKLLKSSTIIIFAGVIGLFIVLGILVVGAFIIGTFVYGMNDLIASDGSHPANVTLPFKDEYGRNIYITNNQSSTDPTFAQLVEFLHNDTTDQTGLSSGKAIVRLHDNAEAQGIRAGVAGMKSASVDLSNHVQEIYGCNVFRTSDRGIIYVDEMGPSEAPADYILFYHLRWKGGTSYAAYYVPIENISKIDVNWKSYPDYNFALSSQQLNETGSVKGEFTIYPNGVSRTW